MDADEDSDDGDEQAQQHSYTQPQQQQQHFSAPRAPQPPMPPVAPMNNMLGMPLMNPFGGLFDSMFNGMGMGMNMQSSGTGGGQVYSYSSSQVFSSGPNGVYQSSSTSRQGPGGVSCSHCLLLCWMCWMSRPVTSCTCLVWLLHTTYCILPDITSAMQLHACVRTLYTSQISRDQPKHACSHASQVRESQQTIRDGRTGHESMTIARGIGDRV